MAQELFCYFRMIVLGGGCVLVVGEFGGLLKTQLTISLKDNIHFPQTLHSKLF